MQLLTVALFLVASQTIFAAESPVVAVVGNKAITLDELNKRYEEVKKEAVNPPPKRVFLEDLIRYEMGVQEAEKRNLQADPIVAERIRQELYKGLIEKELAKKVGAITVTEKEMRDNYESNPELRTRHILIQIKPEATAAERAAAKKRADEIYAEVRKSRRPFEELVNLYTDDVVSKKNGGDVGFQTRLTVAPNYYEAALKLKPGEVSPIVETQFGYHIIQLVKKNSFAEANKRRVRAEVFERKRLALFNEYFEKIKGKYKVTLNLENLK